MNKLQTMLPVIKPSELTLPGTYFVVTISQLTADEELNPAPRCHTVDIWCSAKNELMWRAASTNRLSTMASSSYKDGKHVFLGPIDMNQWSENPPLQTSVQEK